MPGHVGVLLFVFHRHLKHELGRRIGDQYIRVVHELHPRILVVFFFSFLPMNEAVREEAAAA